ncbi:MAG: MFS transporter [Holosporales bacterium]|jgi:MFS family permease|nr:MFS transporter [Holosporales bacterium]
MFREVASMLRGGVLSALCWMHFFWGMASSMIFSLLPIFIVEELGGSSKSFGFLEGAVVFISFIAKVFSGFIIDAFKKKVPMLRVGTALTMASKLFLACAPNVFFVFASKSLDRFAKGLRQAPSDAMLAGLSADKGIVFSLRYSMNLAGFLIGSVITSGTAYFIGTNYRLIFAASVLPTVVAMCILQKKIRSNNDYYELKEKHKWNIRDIALLPREYWLFMGVVALLMFNRFSEGFITLKAKSVLPESAGLFPMFMSAYEICAACVAIPMGRISDRLRKKNVLAFGVGLLVVADIFGMFATSWYSVIAIYIFAGLHMGATQGVIGAVVVKSTPQHLVGTAFAIFYMVEGLTLLCANSLAGLTHKVAKSIALPEASGPFTMGIIASVAAIAYILTCMDKGANCNKTR